MSRLGLPVVYHVLLEHRHDGGGSIHHTRAHEFAALITYEHANGAVDLIFFPPNGTHVHAHAVPQGDRADGHTWRHVTAHHLDEVNDALVEVRHEVARANEMAELAAGHADKAAEHAKAAEEHAGNAHAHARAAAHPLEAQADAAQVDGASKT